MVPRKPSLASPYSLGHGRLLRPNVTETIALATVVADALALLVVPQPQYASYSVTRSWSAWTICISVISSPFNRFVWFAGLSNRRTKHPAEYKSNHHPDAQPPRGYQPELIVESHSSPFSLGRPLSNHAENRPAADRKDRLVERHAAPPTERAVLRLEPCVIRNSAHPHSPLSRSLHVFGSLTFRLVSSACRSL